MLVNIPFLLLSKYVYRQRIDLGVRDTYTYSCHMQ